MRLLLDTHVLLWWLVDDPRLRDVAREAVAEAEDALVSAASVWEIGIKQAAGKLTGPDDLESELDANALEELPVTARHALRAAVLPARHTDPFDRMLIGQALGEQLVVVTRDRRFADYQVPVLSA